MSLLDQRDDDDGWKTLTAKPVADTASSGLNRFLKSITVKPRHEAKFQLQHNVNQVMMTPNGDYLYFSVLDRAKTIQKELRIRYDVVVELAYGPANRKNVCGEKVVDKK